MTAHGAAELKLVLVKTRAQANRVVNVFFRVPASYDERRSTPYRVLILFGGRNFSGRIDASGRLGWGQWADQNEIFIVSPGFKDDTYWQPEEWSGKALLKALADIKKNYNICTDKLLFYGYSAGSQCANLFPAWKPELARAWVSHACGVFHEPSARMRDVPGLVTCGDADISRYLISRDFVEKCRGKNINIIWKSFPNHPHDVPPDSLILARAFLAYHHRKNLHDLTGGFAEKEQTQERFVGDDQESRYYPEKSPQARNILREDRVLLPAQEIAAAWGKSAQ